MFLFSKKLNNVDDNEENEVKDLENTKDVEKTEKDDSAFTPYKDDKDNNQPVEEKEMPAVTDCTKAIKKVTTGYNPVLAILLNKDGDKKASLLTYLKGLAQKSTNQLLGMKVACIQVDDIYNHFSYWTKTEIDRILASLETKNFVNSWDLKFGNENIKCYAINQDAIDSLLASDKAQDIYKKMFKEG